jgi:hypothetical protein
MPAVHERRAAAHAPAPYRRALLTEFKGIGDVGADIFLREAQRAWRELRPYFDERALTSARRLDLPDDTARLAAALVRAGLAKDHNAIRDAAAGG